MRRWLIEKDRQFLDRIKLGIERCEAVQRIPERRRTDLMWKVLWREMAVVVPLTLARMGMRWFVRLARIAGMR